MFDSYLFIKKKVVLEIKVILISLPFNVDTIIQEINEQVHEKSIILIINLLVENIELSNLIIYTLHSD